MEYVPTSPNQQLGGRSHGSSTLRCDSWELRETEAPTMGAIPVSESLFSVGNGFIGIRGHTEEDLTPHRSRHRGHDHTHHQQQHAHSQHGRASNNTTNNNGDANGNRMVSSPGSAGAAARRTPQQPIATSPPPSSPRGYKRETQKVSSVPMRSIRGSYCVGFYEQRLLNRPSSFFVGICTKECFLLRTPDAFCVDVYLAGEHVSASTGRVVSMTRQLDLRTGELRRRMVWESRGREITIESVRFASAVRQNMAVLRYNVSARNVHNTDIKIVSRTQVQGGGAEGGYARHYDIEQVATRYSIQEASSVVLVRTHNSCRHLAVAVAERCTSTLVESIPKVFDSTVAVSLSGSSISHSGSFLTSPAIMNPGTFSMPASPASPSGTTTLTPKCSETDTGAETTFTSCISERMTIELVKFIGFFGDSDAPQEELCDLALQRARAASLDGYDSLQQEHRQAMTRFWEGADVKLETTDRAMQGAFRYNILQINMSCHLSSTQGFPTRGLTGEVNGALHQWDVDALIIPFLTHIYPEKARALLCFRMGTLHLAKAIASDLDIPRGAIIPYRTINGSDSPTPYCAAFLFANAVTAFAMQYYVTATNDYSILQSGGAELVLVTALVWLEWGTWEKGTFNLRCVSGPDVYSGVSDNNFFTNVMAQHHLQWAVQTAEYMREAAPEKWESFLQKCQVTVEDLTAMQRAATHMTLAFDATHRIYPVDQSFMRKKQWRFSEKNGCGHLINTFHPNVIHRHQVCRIPDVMLAIMLLPDRFTSDEVKANFSFYESITSRDSALRFVIYSVVASRINIPDKATSYFRKALFVDVGNIIGNTGAGLHSTTAAGSWWTLAVGFGGMQVVKGVLHFNPTMPEDCSGYQFNARHRGCLVRVNVTQRLVTYTLLEAAAGVREMLVMHCGESKVYLHRGIPEAVRLFREVRVFDFDCVIFELDSIVSDIESVHYESWRRALEQHFHETNFPEFVMTKELYLAYLRHGRPFSGLQAIFTKYERPLLSIGSPIDGELVPTLYGLCRRKLAAFRAYVQEHGLTYREGAFQLLASLREFSIVLGCVTGSRNGRWLLNESPQLLMMFDDVVDGIDGESRNLRWRPEMDYFEACAKGLDAAPHRSIIVMDGIDGFSKASIERFCMVLDVSAEPEEVHLEIPRRLAKSFKEVTIEMLDEYTSKDGVVHHGETAAARTASRKDRLSPKRTSLGVPELSGSGTPMTPGTLDT